MKKNEELLKTACAAMLNAHAPYSKFRVGAALLADNNKIYAGCNVENLSYPCGTCAETGAIAAMVADGGRKIKKILIVSDGTKPIVPCGACLQRIKEFANAKTQVIIVDKDKKFVTYNICDLLPVAFEEF